MRKVRKAIGLVSWTLLVIAIATYIAAKIDFFRYYGASGYLEEHSVYWLILGAIALVAVLLEQALPEEESAQQTRGGSDRR